MEGFRAIQTALQANVQIRFVAIVPGAEAHPQAASLLGLAADRGVAVHTVSEAELGGVIETVAGSGVVALAEWEPLNAPGLADVVSALTHPQASRIVCLDAVSDPGNAGTLMRTAVAFGLDAVLLGKGSVDTTNSKLVRATAGSLFQLPIVVEGLDLAETLEALSGAGWHVFRAETAADSPRPAPPADAVPWALVLGSESHGLSKGLQHLGTPITIPMGGRAESLNVAVAGGILLYSLVTEHGL